jgi:hypothetical protein
MKITCELYSRETCKLITSTDVDSNDLQGRMFGLISDNPFPASEVVSGIFGSDFGRMRYRVIKAFGDCGTPELEQVAV